MSNSSNTRFAKALRVILTIIICAAAALYNTPANACSSPYSPAVYYERKLICNALLRGDTAYVPLETLSRALGAELIYGADRKSAILRTTRHTLHLTCNTPQMRCNNRTFELTEAVIEIGGTIFIPLRAVARALNIDVYYDSERYTITLTEGAGYDPADITEKIRVPVLMYHAVADETWGLCDLFVRPGDLDAQLTWMAENGYTAITFEDLPYIASGMKPVILTFDDGYIDNYTELFPLLKKHGAKATIFVVTNSIGSGKMLTQEQIREMSDSGLVSIQSHTVSHPSLPSLTGARLESELADSQRILTEITGKRPFVISYPNGEHDERVIRAAQEYYAFGIKKDGGIYITGDHPFYVNRRRVSRRTGADGFAALVK